MALQSPSKQSFRIFNFVCTSLAVDPFIFIFEHLYVIKVCSLVKPTVFGIYMYGSILCVPCHAKNIIRSNSTA